MIPLPSPHLHYTRDALVTGLCLISIIDQQTAFLLVPILGLLRLFVSHAIDQISLSVWRTVVGAMILLFSTNLIVLPVARHLTLWPRVRGTVWVALSIATAVIALASVRLNSARTVAIVLAMSNS